MGVVDIDDPNAPVPLGKLDAGTLDSPREVAYAEGKVVIVDDSEGFYVVDVTDPNAPSITAELAIPTDGTSILYSNKFAYVACEMNGIVVVDMMDPANPEIMGLLETPGEADKLLLLHDTYLITADQMSGLTIGYRDCGFDVPVFLDTFTAEAAPGRVDLCWETAAGSSACEFRLVAAGAGESWSVSFAETVPGIYLATDRASHLAGGGEFTYELSSREAGGGWQLLRSRTVRTDAAPFSEGITGAWPNPFNPHVTIAYALAGAGPIRLTVYDLSGRRIASIVDGTLPAGEHESYWDGRNEAGESVASGIYLAKLITRRTEEMQRLVLVR